LHREFRAGFPIPEPEGVMSTGFAVEP